MYGDAVEPYATVVVGIDIIEEKADDVIVFAHIYDQNPYDEQDGIDEEVVSKGLVERRNKLGVDGRLY